MNGELCEYLREPDRSVYTTESFKDVFLLQGNDYNNQPCNRNHLTHPFT